MRTLAIDSTIGGLGDVWMRLSALYSLAALRPHLKIALRVPSALADVARRAWPDRLEIADRDLTTAIRMSHLGLRHLWPRMCRGERFIAPFFQIQSADRKVIKWKHRLNHLLIHAVKVTRALNIPTRHTLGDYQGFHEFSALPEFSEVDGEVFRRQAAIDFPVIRRRLHRIWPRAEDPPNELVVFPSGTGHQIMPPAWAQAHLPHALYAFHGTDKFQEAFKQASLEVVNFQSVDDLFAIAASARRILVTDSFPSHPIQHYTPYALVALTQQPRSRIVHPSFDGSVLDSAAACCPCSNRARGYGPCDSGHEYCVSWASPAYTKNILGALQSGLW